MTDSLQIFLGLLQIPLELYFLLRYFSALIRPQAMHFWGMVMRTGGRNEVPGTGLLPDSLWLGEELDSLGELWSEGSTELRWASRDGLGTLAHLGNVLGSLRGNWNMWLCLLSLVYCWCNFLLRYSSLINRWEIWGMEMRFLCSLAGIWLGGVRRTWQPWRTAPAPLNYEDPVEGFWACYTTLELSLEPQNEAGIHSHG